LSEKEKKKFDGYFDEMKEKNSYVDTAIEGAGMYISLADELDKAHNEELARRNDRNQRISSLMGTKVELEKNRKLGERKNFAKAVELSEIDGVMVAANPLNRGSYDPFNKIKLTGDDLYLLGSSQKKLIELKKAWEKAKGNPELQNKIHIEADLLRNIDKMFREEFGVKASLAFNQPADCIDYIKENDDVITNVANATGVSKSMISAVLIRERMCFAPKDIVGDHFPDASRGIAQIKPSTARECEKYVLEQIFKMSCKNYTDDELNKRLEDPKIAIYYIGIILLAKAKKKGLNASKISKEIISMYNGTGLPQ
jgi:hypothetical protein